MKKRTVLLISGLELEKNTSFTRQLGLLATAFEEKGIMTLLAGPLSSNERGQSAPVFKDKFGRSYKDISVLIRKPGVRAAVLLGYPDQFPFVNGFSSTVSDNLTDRHRYPDIPLFLWSQFSKPPLEGSLGFLIPVPLTERTRSFIISSGYKNPGPVIPHGVDTSAFYPLNETDRKREKSRLELKDRFVIGTVGANTSRKRFKSIIESFACFYKQRPCGSLLIKTDRVVSLDGTDLQAHAREHGVLEAVKFITDDLSESRMRALYGAMDIYVNLSEWEGFCIPVIEAMACSVPVATQPIQGPAELVPYQDLTIPESSIHKEEGRVFLHARPEAVAGFLSEVSAKPALLKTLGAEGRKAALSKYDIRIVAGQWEKLFNKYLKGLA
jgi:glycosyltransferase involved in cell wall biosynthesis